VVGAALVFGLAEPLHAAVAIIKAKATPAPRARRGKGEVMVGDPKKGGVN
jgi:hypothetical protein